MKLDYSQVLINENAYFFKLKRQLSSRDIQIIFEEAVKHKKGTRRFESKLKESYVHGPKEIAKISFDVFSYEKRPSFLTDDVKGVTERKFGLFIIVESKDHLAIVRKNISGVNHLYTLVQKIDYNVLVRFLLQPTTKFEKIVTNSMNTAANAMQKKTSESTDLQGVMPRFGTSKQIIASLRVGNKEDKSTVTINTSRVNSFNIHNDFGPAILWMVEMMDLIRSAEKQAPKNNFIDGFANPIDFDEIIDEIEPIFLMIRLDALKDEMDAGQVNKIYNINTGKKVDFKKDILDFERLFPLKVNKKGVYESPNVKVKVKEESISVAIEPFKKIMVDFGDGHEIDLNSYLTLRSHYMIVFDQIQYVYSHGRIFEDSRLLGDKDNFMNAFIDFNELIDIDSEKGENYLPSSKSFKQNSLFRFVDDQFGPNVEYLLCDDLGTEWGDFISLKDDEITFFHLKHNDSGLSAKNLENVFGQAQKNFGFLQLTDEMIEARRSKWTGNYRINNIATSISRMRKAPHAKATIDELIIYASSVSMNPNVRRRVFIVVNFISKSELSKMFDTLKNSKALNIHNHGVALQILWFVHGMLALATELNAEFRILCRP